MGKQWKQGRTLFWGLQNHCRWWLQPWNLKMIAPWKKNYDKLRQHIKKQRHHFATQDLSSQSYVWIWKLDHKEGWVPKNRCFWTVVLEKTLESPLDSKEIKPVNPKGNQPWIFTGRTEAETEAPIFWSPDAKSWLIGKDTDAGKDWGQDKGWQKIRCLYGITDSVDISFSKFWEIVKDRENWRAAVHEIAKSQKQLSDWTTTKQPVSYWIWIGGICVN